MDTVDTLILHKRKAEKFFAACAFMYPDDARTSCQWLSWGEITDQGVQRFWREMLEHNEGEGSQASAAISAGIFTDITGWITELPTGSFHPDIYAREIKRDAYLVRVSTQQGKLAVAIRDREFEAVSGVIQEMAADSIEVQKSSKDAGDACLEFMDNLQKGAPVGVKTGITSLDRAMGGFELQKHTILAARPSMGKTTLAWEIARNVAKAGQKVLMVSMEMTTQSLIEKMVFGACRIDRRKFIAGALTEQEKERLHNTATDMMNMYSGLLIIDDCPRQTLESIWERVMITKPVLVVTDRLDMISHPAPEEVKRLGVVSMALRTMARETNAHFLTIHQLNRGVEQRADKIPLMSDLRGSGEIEQNADNILVLHREDYYKLDAKPPEISDTKLVVAKFREGVRNIEIDLRYHLLEQWFYSKGEI
jgi:replicative DNA helicase